MSSKPLRPATFGVQSPMPSEPKAFDVGPEHVPESHFDMQFMLPDQWLEHGSQLLRASKAIARQAAIDTGVQRACAKSLLGGQSGLPSAMLRARLEMPEALLAVLAVENGLKAVIAGERMKAGSAATPISKLPEDYKSHDLEVLATRAVVTTTDAAELEVLAAGKAITEGLGRYPTMTTAKDTPTTFSMKPQETLEACERLFFRCVDASARALHPRMGHGKSVDEFVEEYRKRWVTACGGVSLAWGGEEQVALHDGWGMVLAKGG